jgi:NAD(P)-dependent dehydrogenase (short-subunit alcohol dehydrogenase family)
VIERPSGAPGAADRAVPPGWFGGRVVVVTGAASGLGSAITAAFLRAGAHVAMLDVAADRLRDAERALRTTGRCVGFVVDVTDAPAVEGAMARIEQELGPIAVVVANAGIYPNTPFLDVTEAEWDRVLGINLKGAFLTCQAAARLMTPRGDGTIITLASGVAVSSLVGWSHYAASKAAIVSLTRSMAIELGPQGIRVNCIQPGYFEVPGGAHLDDSYRATMRGANVLGRPGDPDDVASAALLLASPLAGFITGAVLPVDGGSSAGRIGMRPRTVDGS